MDTIKPAHTDIRLRSLSYSSLLTLHSCPRKYQLYRLNSKVDKEEDTNTSVTFAYGHVVGLGIQEYITHHNEDKALWAMFLLWYPDLLDENIKQQKSFWSAIQAVQRFIAMCNAGYLADWKLAYYNGKPATELSFIVKCPDGFTYKGYVDAVLQNDVTGEVMVLEVKTTASPSVAAATYKNSFQAIGYSIVLDALFPDLSSYTVQYLVYKTKSREYDSLPFVKDYLQRALWIRTLLLEIETIKQYEVAGIYPQHGESCYDFYRECEYMNICTLSTESLTTPLDPEAEAEIQKRNDTEFQITLTLGDLIAAQLDKE